MSLPFVPGDYRMKVFKQRSRLQSLTNYEVTKHCGMRQEHVMELLDLLGERMEPQTKRNHSICAETKVLVSLSFFRSGSFQYVEGTVGGVSQSAMSVILEQFSSIICTYHANNYLFFPNDNLQLNLLKTSFFEMGMMPNIVGVIDGTHIPIKAPVAVEAVYVNRKGYHSINVQVTCSSNNTFLDAVAKFPGSTHDSYMWQNSGLRRRFMNGDFGESWLLGDSGYPCEPFLITPLKGPLNQPEILYNSALTKRRSIVERSIGIWKARFRSMDKSGGSLCYSPTKCCKLITTSLVLHNYCMGRNILLEDAEDNEFAQNYMDDMTAPIGIVDYDCGVVTRNNVVQNYFTIN